MTQKNGERWYEAELYRLKGELTLTQSKVQRLESSVTNPQSLIPNPHSEAEACFLKAIEIAHRQRARALELRAVMSLSRLWQAQERKEEAGKLLAGIYSWFSEGFNMPDLQEARALLDELTKQG
jgi:predicted ATPase